MIERADRWIKTPHLRPDHRGPVERAFVPFVDPAEAPPIADLLGAAAARHPDRAAFADDETSLTFRQFEQAVRRLGAAIASRPAPGPVAVLLPPDISYAVAVFACLAAGRPSLLLDDNHPPARNAALARNAGAGLLLAASASDLAAGETVLPTLDVSAFLTVDAPQQAADVRPLDLDAPAFLLSTSGSAGEPKLIAHSQRTMLHWVRTLHDAMHVDAGDRVLSVSAPASLGGITALLTFALAGAANRMIALRKAGLGGLLDTLAAEPVTILRAAPSLLRALCQHPDLARPALARLRIVQAYGEPLLKADLAALRTIRQPDCLVRTTYGSTESSGLSWYAGDPDDHDPLRVAAGALMPDTRARIVNANGNDCPAGSEGELVIASRYNALGEWIDGKLTPGRLMPDPDEPGARLFRTGDLARCSADGIFVVLGRIDRMAKINGQRVEPAEIEAVLRARPELRRAEVAVGKELGVARLFAFVVPDGEPAPDLARDLRQALTAVLPHHMLPSRIVLLDAIPLLPGGKVDHKALLAQAGAR